jgi:hypothetical protein
MGPSNAGGSQTMSEPGDVRPSWWYASIGVVLALAGVGLFAYFLVHGLFHLTDSLTQVVVPGQAQLSLKAPATYTIFLEEQSVVDGRIYSTTESVDGLKCTVTSQSENQQIPLRQPGMSITYNVNGRSGKSVLAFPVKVAGQYTLFCNYPQDTRGPQTVVAIGTGVGEKLTQTVLWSLISMFGGMGTGALVIALVILKRRAAEKELAAPSHPSP